MANIEGRTLPNWEGRVLKNVYKFSQRYHEGIPELSNRVEGVISRLFGYRRLRETMREGEPPRLNVEPKKYKDSGFYNG